MPEYSPAASVASYVLGGKTYAFKTVGRCLTCQSPHRLQIEQAIASGTPYARIIRDLDLMEGKSRVTATSMASHFKNGHMPIQTEVLRRVLERKAEERGASLEDGIENVVDSAMFAEVILTQTMQRITEGELRPDIGHGMEAAKILAALRPHEDAAAESDYVAAFMAYHSIAQDLMTESQFAEFGRRLMVHPVLQALTEKYGQATGALESGDFYQQQSVGEDDIEDAEVVGESS